MIGDLVLESKGKTTGQRVLPNPGGGPKMETTFEAQGKVLGVKTKEVGTYWSVGRPDGTVYGEGQGIIMGKGGEMATWVGGGVGTVAPDGSARFRGAIYVQTTASAWARLNSVALVFEYDVDAQGNTRAKDWEWK